jgi:hypothetical protein
MTAASHRDADSCRCAKLAAVVAALAPEREQLLILVGDVRERLQADPPAPG